jgi:hypothetical protein
MNITLNELITVLQKRLDNARDLNFDHAIDTIHKHDLIREAWNEFESQVEKSFKENNERKAKKF